MVAYRGFAFPLALDGQGGLRLAENADYIKGLILSFVQVYKGERLGLPGYGLNAYLFSPYQTLGFVAKDVEQELRQAIPEAEFSVTSQLSDNGDGSLTIFWAYRNVDQEPLSFEVTLDGEAAMESN